MRIIIPFRAGIFLGLVFMVMFVFNAFAGTGPKPFFHLFTSMEQNLTWFRNPANDHEYTVLLSDLTWEEAEKVAVSLSGHLVAINNAEENQWIVDHLFDYILQNVSTFEGCWIGYTDRDQGGRWEWVSGENSAYTNWVPGEPNGGSLEEYGELYYSHDGVVSERGHWNDLGGYRKLFAIVERSGIAAPTSTPTQQPASLAIYNLDGSDLQSNHLVAGSPVGFKPAKLSFGSIPLRSGSDGQGLTLQLAPGTGSLIFSLDAVKAPMKVRISGVFRASNRGVGIALVALNSPIDNQYAYLHVIENAIPVDTYRTLNLFYAPPSGVVQIGLLAVNSLDSLISTTVWVDELRVESYIPSESTLVDLEAKVDFEEGLNKSIVNMNDTGGDVTPFFTSTNNMAVRLSIKPDQLAANIGTLAKGAVGPFPMLLFAGVSARHDSLSPGGQTALFFTNGSQNVGLFRTTGELPGPPSASAEDLWVGGSFEIENPNVPVYIFVQNGGPNVESSIVIDNLVLFKQQ